MNGKLVLTAFAAFALMSCATAQSSSNPSLKVAIVEYGPFSSKITKDTQADGTLSGQVHLAGEIQFGEKSDHIVATIGTSFGLRYFLTGTGDVDHYAVMVKMIHPQFGAGGKGETEEEWVDDGPVDIPRLAGFQFDHDYELAPGEWRIEIWKGNVKYAEKKFLISK